MLPRLRTTIPIGLALTALVSCHPEKQPLLQDAEKTTPTIGAISPGPSVPIAEEKHMTDVLIDKAGIRLDNDPRILVPISANPSKGADAPYKRSGINDLFLVPLAEALKSEIAAGRVAKSLRVVVAEDTTYRFLIEALFTAGQAEIGTFALCENACGRRSISFDLPRLGPSTMDPAIMQRLNFAAIVTENGISLKAGGSNIGPGCTGAGPGIAIPRIAGSLDLAALKNCADRAKAADPAFAQEDQATITANGGIPFREVVDVALTLQGPAKTLLPKLTFGIAK